MPKGAPKIAKIKVIKVYSGVIKVYSSLNRGSVLSLLQSAALLSVAPCPGIVFHQVLQLQTSNSRLVKISLARSRF